MTTPDDFAKCSCQHCDGPFEIPRTYLGRDHECPHCRRQTRIVESKQVQPLPKEPPTLTPLEALPIRRVPKSYTISALLGGLIGLFMIVSCITEAESTTVFQQIAVRLLGVGGVIVVGMALILEGLSPVLRSLWEIALRLQSIEERLAHLSRKP